MKRKEDTRTALASTKADLRELKGNSHATVQELQEFLRELKGKSPQEMLGVVASNQLFRSLVLSSALVAAAILFFTAIPYFFGEEETPIAETPAPAPTPENVAPEAPAPPPAEPTANPLSELGVGEELPAPPNVNPLENTGDDFLKDLE